MNTTNDNAWNEVTYYITKTKTLQDICNELYTDEVRTTFKGLTKEQINAIYQVYTKKSKQ